MSSEVPPTTLLTTRSTELPFADGGKARPERFPPETVGGETLLAGLSPQSRQTKPSARKMSQNDLSTLPPSFRIKFSLTWCFILINHMQ